ncbi:hypothetical protein [Raineya orbicola]|jgi:hypothetical protein|uniref:Secreted protein n=1 Tax=Raineya orbicola TaxID=2016530 RepID=A0A2N3I997_9BACT|nr:hypothetical protein [Raineya orbicola]PKQ66896.1 hypothetical protein Rain11_2237 [Raineya orbicola]
MKKKLKKLGVLVLVLMNITTSVEASRWRTDSEYTDPLTGCHVKHQTCVAGFGFAFCEVGSTRIIMTCPPSGNPNSGNEASVELAS